MYTLLHGFYKYLVQKDEYCVLILGLDNAGKTTYLEATKTKFTKKYKAMNPNRITTTVGLNIGKIDVEGVRLSFWDLGGQVELQSLWDKYFAECHAVIYIVDSSDRERISESKETFVFQTLPRYHNFVLYEACIQQGRTYALDNGGKSRERIYALLAVNVLINQDRNVIPVVNQFINLLTTTDGYRGKCYNRMIASEQLSGVPLLVLANKQDIPDCMGVHTVKPIFNQNAHLIGARDIMLMATSALTGDGVDEGIRWLVDCIKRNSAERLPRNHDDNL